MSNEISKTAETNERARVRLGSVRPSHATGKKTTRRGRERRRFRCRFFSLPIISPTTTLSCSSLSRGKSRAPTASSSSSSSLSAFSFRLMQNLRSFVRSFAVSVLLQFTVSNFLQIKCSFELRCMMSFDAQKMIATSEGQFGSEPSIEGTSSAHSAMGKLLRLLTWWRRVARMTSAPPAVRRLLFSS